MKTSIIIPTYNLSWMTINLLDSIRHTVDQGEYNIVLVDNGSAEGEFSAVLKHVYLYHRSPGHIFHHTKEQLGFVKAVNRGISIARGAGCTNVFILNNDTIVTGDWFYRMGESLKQSTTGIVGCMTNGPDWRDYPHPQMMIKEKMSYEQIKKHIEPYSAARARHFFGEVQDVNFHPFFCVGMSMRMIEDIGMLDEDFGMGLFDDDDYCYRALQAGWKIKSRLDVYVHHYHRSSWIEHNIDYDKLLKENRTIFKNKHGFDPWDRVKSN